MPPRITQRTAKHRERRGDDTPKRQHRTPQAKQREAKGEKLKLQKIPPLVTLKHGNPYCEDCNEIQQPGWQVAWWPVNGRASPTTVVCAPCHHNRIRAMNPKRRRRGQSS
jgi:hypothetical protein